MAFQILFYIPIYAFFLLLKLEIKNKVSENMCLFFCRTITCLELEISTHGFHFRPKWADFHPCSWWLLTSQSLLTFVRSGKLQWYVYCFPTHGKILSPHRNPELVWGRTSKASLDCMTRLQLRKSPLCLEVRPSGWAGDWDRGSLTLVLKERENTVPFCSVGLPGSFNQA